MLFYEFGLKKTQQLHCLPYLQRYGKCNIKAAVKFFFAIIWVKFLPIYEAPRDYWVKISRILGGGGYIGGGIVCGGGAYRLGGVIDFSSSKKTKTGCDVFNTNEIPINALH